MKSIKKLGRGVKALLVIDSYLVLSTRQAHHAAVTQY
jgi:hypothetical protein